MQRRQARKREARAAKRLQEKGRDRGLAELGEEGVGSAIGSGDEGGGDDPMDAEAPHVQPFVRPKLPRKVLAARVKLLEDTAHELRLQGADASQLQPVERSLEDARRDVKLAGGATDGGLRTAIMAEGRRLAKREAAIGREEKKRDQLQREVEEAIARVAKQNAEIGQLRDKLEYSRERYSYLVAQQAAEGQRAPHAEAVHKAFAAIAERSADMGHEMQGHVKLVSEAVSLVFGGGLIDGKEAFAGAWIDSESDERGEGDEEDERDLDDEPEVSGEMLHEVHQAGSVLRAARVERNKALIDACRSGAVLAPKADAELKAKIRASVEALVAATAKRDAARDAARRRIEAEEAESRRREARRVAEEAERTAAATAEAASVATAAGAAAAAGAPRGVQDSRGHAEEEARRGAGMRDEERCDDTPCPPPAKWRRAASEDSEPTAEEEEEVPQLAMAVDGGDDLGAGSSRQGNGSDCGEGQVGGRAMGGRGGGSVRAATLALEAKGASRRERERRDEDMRRVEVGGREGERLSAPRSAQEVLADGAVGITRLAMAGGARRRGRTVEPARSRSPNR